MTSSQNAIIRDSRRLQHILNIQGAKAGDTFKAGLLNGNLGSVTITQIAAGELRLDCDFNQKPPAPLPLTLILGLPRPKMLRRIFQTLATLGAKNIYLVNSFRVEKSYWQTPFLQPEAIRQQLLLGLEQGCDTLMPQVHLAKRFKPFVEDELPAISVGTRALVAHPYTPNSCPTGLREDTTLAVGPEGGFIPYEIELLNNTGFQAVSLGSRIMRVETAIPYLISRLF